VTTYRMRTARIALIAVAVFVVLSDVASAAPASTTPEPAATPFPCTNAISTAARPPTGYEAIAGVVALPTKKKFAGGDRRGSDGFRFAKQGLLVKTGASVELIVPPAWAQRVNIAWGDAPRTTHLQITNCGTNPQVTWLVYAGGFYVTERACVPLIVRAGGHDDKVHIAVGKSCSPK